MPIEFSVVSDPFLEVVTADVSYFQKSSTKPFLFLCGSSYNSPHVPTRLN
jgi:hypothetical protein